MLLHGCDALESAARTRRALPGFVAYNLETAQAIVMAAERSGLPVLLQAGSSAFRHAGLHPLAMLALELARRSEAEIGVHLDHSRSLEEIETCLSLGYTSVMVDGSSLPFEQNVALTKAVVERARAHGAWVEAELGAIAGDEDVSSDVEASSMTDPDQAAELVALTHVDALAVAVGNVHGFGATPPAIDLDRLAALARSAGVPLVLHGASGLRDDVVRACVDLGVAKVNVNAELRRSFLAGLEQALPGALANEDLLGALSSGREAVALAAERIARLLARAGEPAGGPGARGDLGPRHPRQRSMW